VWYTCAQKRLGYVWAESVILARLMAVIRPISGEVLSIGRLSNGHSYRTLASKVQENGSNILMKFI
jgi:hypothetical protein